MRRHSPRQQFNEALQIARDYGLKVVVMPGRYLLYRIVQGADRNTFIGSRGSVEGLRELVGRAAGSVSVRELGNRLQARGYDLEELERDNPYNAWMAGS